MSFLSEHAFGLLGKRLSKKYLIIESDDWGLMMMPSKAAFSQLQASGIPVDTCPYNTYDALETKEDIAQLHEVCNSFKDVMGNPLQITANFIMANPDFEAIRNSKYERYQYHDLCQTYLKYQGGLETLEAIKEAYQLGTFMPQLHGREHLQVNHWLDALRHGDAETQLAFDAGVFGHPSAYAKKTRVHFLSAFHISNTEELAFAGQSVQEASSLFRDTFGFTSKTFIAPRYIWPVELEPYFKQAGITTLQGMNVQFRPKINDKLYGLKKKINWMGKDNSFGLSYIIRNIFFEPSQNPSWNWERQVLYEVKRSFIVGKPAVISMHRLNFVSGFSLNNRSNNLTRFQNLIALIQSEYPDIEFINSSELYSL